MDKDNEDLQYSMIAARRLATDGMMWQTPMLSLTAQAFLFNVALGPGVSTTARLIASFLALMAALCSTQLFAKHRYLEVQDAKWLANYEERKWGIPLHGPRDYSKCRGSNRIVAWSSYKIWRMMLMLFAVASFLNICIILFTPDKLDPGVQGKTSPSTIPTTRAG